MKNHVTDRVSFLRYFSSIIIINSEGGEKLRSLNPVRKTSSHLLMNVWVCHHLETRPVGGGSIDRKGVFGNTGVGRSDVRAGDSRRGSVGRVQVGPSHRPVYELTGSRRRRSVSGPVPLRECLTKGDKTFKSQGFVTCIGGTGSMKGLRPTVLLR